MASKIESIQILYQRRNVRSRGPTSSANRNDSANELSHDLANIIDQWNNRLTPLTTTLPNQSGTDNVDAFQDGLSARTIFVNDDATSGSDSRFYSTTYTRPSTIYEAMDAIYTSIDTLETDLEGQITAISLSAAQVPIADSSNLYASNNVEAALAEVMTAVNSISIGALDLSAVAQHYLPATDNTYDIGSASKRVRDIYAGPSSLRVGSLVGDTANSIEKQYQFAVNTDAGSHTGKLEIREGGTPIVRMSSTGVSFPVGISSALDDLSDVATAGAADNDALVYNLGTNSWAPEAIPRTAAALTDTSIAGPSNRELLVYNGAAWANGTYNLSDLADTTIAGPASGVVLMHNGSSWINDPITLTQLNDVTITTPASGVILLHTGSGWEETTLPITTSVGTKGTVAIWDDTDVLGTDTAFVWDIDNSRMGLAELSPDDLLTASGVFGLGMSSTPSARTSFGKLWYDTDSTFHILDEAGQEGIVLQTTVSTTLASGLIGMFEDSGQMTTHSGLHFDYNSQTLGVGEESPNPDASIDISHVAGPVILPRLTTTERDAIPGVSGMIIYNTSIDKAQVYSSGVWDNLN